MAITAVEPPGSILPKVVPWRVPDAGDAALLEDLGRRCGHHWNLIQALCRRADVRRTRVKLLLLLHRRACPVGVSAPRRSWYVPGAVVAAGSARLQAWWEEAYGEPAPSDRALRGHLSVLERAGAIVRSPGELIQGATAWSTDHPPPRQHDTIHLVLRQREANWWATVGRGLLESNPKARHSAAAWWKLFRRWRHESADEQLELPFDGPLEASTLPATDPSREQRSSAAELAPARAELLEHAAAAPDALSMLAACAAAGAAVKGAAQFRVAAQPARLARAMRQLAGELRRGRMIRNRAGWLLWAFEHEPGGRPWRT